MSPRCKNAKIEHEEEKEMDDDDDDISNQFQIKPRIVDEINLNVSKV